MSLISETKSDWHYFWDSLCVTLLLLQSSNLCYVPLIWPWGNLQCLSVTSTHRPTAFRFLTWVPSWLTPANCTDKAFTGRASACPSFQSWLPWHSAETQANWGQGFHLEQQTRSLNLAALTCTEDRTPQRVRGPLPFWTRAPLHLYTHLYADTLCALLTHLQVMLKSGRRHTTVQEQH